MDDNNNNRDYIVFLENVRFAYLKMLNTDKNTHIHKHYKNMLL